MRSPDKMSSQVQQTYTAPYFVSHLDSMSSHELTSHLHSFQSVSRFWNLCKSSIRPCRPVPCFFLSDLICYLSLCTSALQLMCEPCNVLQSGPRFDFLQLFFPFRKPMQVVIAPAVQFPYGPMQRLCHPAHFFPFVVSQNSSTQKKIANLKSQIPSLAFHSEQHANAQTKLPLYFPLRILCKAPML